MTAAPPRANDLDIIGLNSVGLSLSRIARELGVHHTTVTYRLKTLKIPPADTRRAFMEEIFDGLSLAQQRWLIDQLGSGHAIKDLIRSLLVREFVTRSHPKTEQ
jgi:AcrR family transcriptional regulator